MHRLSAALAVFFATVFVHCAAAAEWVQIEAHPTLSEAESRARAYAGVFPNVEGFRLRSGWYAIALGPYEDGLGAQRLYALLSERLVPADSYVQNGSTYVAQFWPVAGDFTPDAASPDARTADVPPPEVTPPAPVPDPVLAEETPAEARRAEAALGREERELIQTALHWEGVYDSGIDGAFGPGTRKAMAAWQEMHGYPATGVLTSRQRGELVAGYQAVIASLGLVTVRDNTAGIEMKLPMAMIEKGAYQPPFVHFESRTGDGPRVILISQSGDQATLYGLYDILQTLEIMPLTGPRERKGNGFVIEGANAAITSYAEARLTSAGNVKGFILIWPQGDDRRRDLVLAAMRDSFTPIGDSVLPDTAGDGGAQDVDLLSGLQIRRPDLTRTGFYFDASGHVLTSADAVASCGRITIDDTQEVTVLASDAALGVAVLAARQALVPIRYARFQPGQPRLGSEIAVSGYAYDGRLGASVLTYGQLADLKGLDGNADLARLSLRATSGEAGGPVFDGSGAVIGLLLPQPKGGSQVLPEDVVFAAKAAALSNFLSAQGLVPVTAEPAGDIPPEELTTRARDMTVLVSCWN